MIHRTRAPLPGRSRRTVRTAAALAAVLALGGCAISNANLTKLLVETTEDFHDGVRWQKHEVVSEHLRGATKEAYLKRSEVTDGVPRVSEIELIRSTVAPDARSAVLRFRYHWLRDAEVSLQRSVVIQHWRFAGKAWFIEKIEAGGGPEFPLFAAPPARPAARPAAPPPPEGRR